MDITYRKAGLPDVELLVAARLSLLEEDSGAMTDNERQALYQGNKDHMQGGMANGSFFAFMAFEGDVLVGTCSACLYAVLPGRKLPNGKNAYIQNVFVDPRYRRNGIGKKLVSMCVDEAMSMNYNRITLHATGKGQLLFADCGFKPADNEKLVLMVYV